MNGHKAIIIAGLILGYSLPAFSQMEASLKIGVILPRSGPLAPYSDQIVAGMEVALEELEAINPKARNLITLVFRDDKGSSSTAYEQANELYQREKVHAIIGSLTSPASLAINDASIKNEKILIVPSSSITDVISNNPQGYSVSLSETKLGSMLGKFASNNLHKGRALLITTEDSYFTLKSLGAFEAEFRQNGGQTVGQITYNPNDPQSLSAVAQAVQEKTPDVVVAPGYFAEVAPVMKHLVSQGVSVPFLGTDLWESPNFVETMGPEAGSGHYFITHFSADDLSANVKEFVSEYEAATNKRPTSLAAMGYDSMKILLEAYLSTQSNRTPVLVRALEEAPELQGLTGGIVFDRDRTAVKNGVIMATTSAGFKFITRFSM
ncbi:MAG: ABC transporter substrate-binding protein [Oligoflexales bacterium]